METIDICKHCKGTGLEPCEENKNITAKDKKSYIDCSLCHGNGKPKYIEPTRAVERKPNYTPGEHYKAGDQ